MSVKDIYQRIHSPDYDFLWQDEHIKNNIIMLGYGGSHAYGLNTPESDVDLRGIALNSADELLWGKPFEQVVDKKTDTTVYGFNKIIKLLSECNPNTIEMLGLRDEDYIILEPEGKQLVDNRKMFLSQRAAHGFGGYANAQLHRLSNKAARLVPQSELEEHILKSVQHAFIDMLRGNEQIPTNAFRLFIDESNKDEYDTEIFCNVHLDHYPLRDFKNILNGCGEIVKSYSKLGKRNSYAIEQGRLAKHMCHLVRLYKMGIDILEKEEIITYRVDDHDLLMSIRNGEYLDANRQPIPEFFEMVDALEQRFNYAKSNTSLPVKPDYDKIGAFVRQINMNTIGKAGEF